MTDSFDVTAVLPEEATDVNLTASLSILSFSTIGDTPELCQTLGQLIHKQLKSYEVGRRVTLEAIPVSETETKQWLTYTTFLPVNRWAETATMFQELAMNLSVEAHERYDFPPGTVFYGSQLEILDNQGQAEESGIEQFNQIQTHQIATVFNQSIMLNGLRKRVADLEALTNTQAQEIDELDRHLRGNTVMNFEYREMHHVPAILHAIIEHIGADKIKEKFVGIMDEQYPDVHRVH